MLQPDPACKRCSLHQTTERVCVMSPLKQCDIMVVGEAPGRREEETGLLFNGSAGEVLWTALAARGIKRDDVFVANAVNCRPPKNRKPKKGEIKACHDWLKRQIAEVKPKFVLILGNTPLISLTGSAGIRKVRGKVEERGGIYYFATYHPAALLYDDKLKATFEADIRQFAEVIKFGGPPREKALDYTIVRTMSDFEDMLEDLEGTVSFDIESTGLYQWEPDRLLPINPCYPNVKRRVGVNSIGFGTAGHQWCWPIHHPGAPKWDDLAEMFRRVTEALSHCFIVGHNGKFDTLWVWVRHGVRWDVDFDTMLAHYMLDENSRHDLKGLSQIYCAAPNYDEEVELKTGENYTLEQHCLYLAHDVYYTRKLRFIFGRMLAEDAGVKQVFDHILMPCARIYTQIEFDGVPVNMGRMSEVEVIIRDELASAEAELSKYTIKYKEQFDSEINLRSPQQLAKFFFGVLQLSPLDKTGTGKPSTNESVLLRLDHPAARALIRYRGADQLLKMFIDGWKPFLVNGRLHPSFKLHGTVTGRPSCEHPNLQQVPRDPRIRSLIATILDDWVIIEIDLSQIEMRIAGEMSGDAELLRCFTHGIDVHWRTALTEISRGGAMKDEVILTVEKHLKRKVSYAEAIHELLKMGPELASSIMPTWKEIRKKAKAVNFGYLFGMWWKKFKLYARDNYGIEVTDKQAQESRKSFFQLYKSLAPWHDRQKRFARRNGYVRSLSGAKRRLPAAMSPHDSPQRGEAERQAINSPVQRFACELNLMTLIQISEEFSHDLVRPIGTIHDAVLFECHASVAEQLYRRAEEIMRGPALLKTLNIRLRVPIEGEAKIGAWGKGVSLAKWKAQRA